MPHQQFVIFSTNQYVHVFAWTVVVVALPLVGTFWVSFLAGSHPWKKCQRSFSLYYSDLCPVTVYRLPIRLPAKSAVSELSGADSQSILCAHGIIRLVYWCARVGCCVCLVRRKFQFLINLWWWWSVYTSRFSTCFGWSCLVYVTTFQDPPVGTCLYFFSKWSLEVKKPLYCGNPAHICSAAFAITLRPLFMGAESCEKSESFLATFVRNFGQWNFLCTLVMGRWKFCARVWWNAEACLVQNSKAQVTPTRGQKNRTRSPSPARSTWHAAHNAKRPARPTNQYVWHSIWRYPTKRLRCQSNSRKTSWTHLRSSQTCLEVRRSVRLRWRPCSVCL